jgi:hypothetical protein
VRITAIALASTLMLSAIIGAYLVNLAVANPGWAIGLPDEPVTTPPTIVVNTPVQGQTFNSTNVLLNFSIVKPETWFPSEYYVEHGFGDSTFGNITSVYFSVDNGEWQNFTVHDTDTFFTAFAPRTLNFSNDLTLAEGEHNLTVSLDAYTVYVLRVTGDGWELPHFVVHSDSETINFTVALPEPASMPFPTLPVAVAFGASVAAVTVGSLVYWKKRRR